MRVSRTIYSHYAQARCHDFDPASPIPHTAILEIEMEEPKIIQIGSYSPSSACNAKVLDVDGICPTLLDHKGMEPAVIEPMFCALRGRSPENPSDRTAGTNTEQRLEIGSDVATCLTSVQKDSMVCEPCILGYTRNDKGSVQSYHEKAIVGTLHTSSGCGGNTDQYVKTSYCIRKLTERECFRLMDVDDTDIDKIDACRIKTTLKDGTVKEKPIPKSQKYKMAGNSIVVSCLYHIFYQMFIAEPPKPKPIQKSLFDQ